MSTPSDDDGPVWPPPGETAALEPDTLPNHPLRAEDAEALLPKEIG